MKNITIPSSVTSIGSNPFASCRNLQFIKVSDGNANYSNNINGIVYNKEFTSIICYPSGIQNTTFEIPNTVISICESAFSSCSSLQYVTIPISVTSIGNSAFQSCSELETVTIGECVETIGDYAFYYCSSLKNITIPNSITSIGNYAFQSCS